MTALMTATRFLKTDAILAAPVLALQRARAATLDYCTVSAADGGHSVLRDLTPIEAMYAYFGADDVGTNGLEG